MSFSDKELGPALRDRRIWGRGQEEGERDVDTEASLLNFKCHCIPWMGRQQSF